MDENTKKELQSAAFERLLNHLREKYLFLIFFFPFRVGHSINMLSSIWI